VQASSRHPSVGTGLPRDASHGLREGEPEKVHWSDDRWQPDQTVDPRWTACSVIGCRLFQCLSTATASGRQQIVRHSNEPTARTAVLMNCQEKTSAAAAHIVAAAAWQRAVKCSIRLKCDRAPSARPSVGPPVHPVERPPPLSQYVGQHSFNSSINQ